MCVRERESNLLKRGTKIHDDRCHNREAGQISVPDTPEKTNRVYTEKGENTSRENREGA